MPFIEFLIVIVVGSSSLSSALELETSSGGRIWNLSTMTGWLSTKCLLSAVSIKDTISSDKCICQAVITQVNSTNNNYVVRVHMPCRRKVDCNDGHFCCQRCGIDHLNEMLNKPGQLVRFSC